MHSIYLWVKIFHILFMVAWMAGLLYVPRLFVYHSQQSSKSDASEVFKIMEYRLYYYIATPSAVFVWITGLYMAYTLGFYNWIAIKFIFVIFMTVYHLLLRGYLINFKNDVNKKSTKFFRLINEIPFLLLLIIVVLVVLKPF